jgi:membrane protease YdiL (CAAX protease family)
MRVYILRGGIGSAAVGAALFWLVWHWLYDKAGLDHLDLLAALFGAVVGIIGWKRRSA